MKKYAVSILWVFLFVSCQSNKQKTIFGEIPVIDIAEAWEENNIQDINASDLYSEVTYIPLETNDSILIGKLPHIDIRDNYILMGGLLFDKSGKFITKLGKTGQGPGEFLLAADDLFNEERKEYYALDNYRPCVQVYDINNHYLRTIPIPSFSKDFFLINKDQLLFTNKRGFRKNRDDYEYNYVIIGVEKGDTLYKYTSITKNEIKEIQSLYITPFDVFWNYNNNLNYYDGIRDTIYSLKEGRIDQPRYTVDFGKYKNFEEFKKISPTEYKIGMYMKIITIYEYKNYLQFYVTYHMEYKRIMYNKTDGSTFVLGKIQKNIDGIYDESPYVWPSELDEDQLKTISSKTGKTVKEDDNPIVVYTKE